MKYEFVICIEIIFGMLFHSAASACPNREYKKLRDELNQELSQIQSSRSCGNPSLALSCGDKKCDIDAGENEETCPTDCSPALIHSYNSQTFCKQVKKVFTPETYDEVRKIILEASQRSIHVKIVGTLHTTSGLICTDGYVISTERLNHILGLEDFEGQETVVVEPGVTERALTDWLHEHQRSIGYGLVGFRGISVGGITANAAHGSSAKHSAVMSSAIQSVLLVTASGELKEFSEKTTDPTLFKALRAHIGALGAVVQLRLKVRPQFNLKTRVTYDSEKAILGQNNAVDLVKNCDFGQIHWFPSAGKIMKTCGMETSRKANPGATNIYLDPHIPSSLIAPYKLLFHYGACSSTVNSLLERFRLVVTQLMPIFKREGHFGHIKNTDHVVGPSHKILSSELGLGQHTLIVRDWEVAIPQAYVPAALNALHDYMRVHKLAVPITGFYIRFTPVEDRILLSNAGTSSYFHKGEVATYIEFPTYFPIGYPKEFQEKYNSQYEEMLKMMIEKFHGRGHWGKNNESIQAIQKQVGSFEEVLPIFRKIVQEFDPKGLFENEFTRQVLEPQNSLGIS